MTMSRYNNMWEQQLLVAGVTTRLQNKQHHRQKYAYHDNPQAQLTTDTSKFGDLSGRRPPSHGFLCTGAPATQPRRPAPRVRSGGAARRGTALRRAAPARARPRGRNQQQVFRDLGVFS